MQGTVLLEGFWWEPWPWTERLSWLKFKGHENQCCDSTSAFELGNANNPKALVVVIYVTLDITVSRLRQLGMLVELFNSAA